MQRYLVYIAGGAVAGALGLAGILMRDAAPAEAPRADLAQDAAPPAVPVVAPAVVSEPAPAPVQVAGLADGLDARIDELTSALAVREAELSALQASLAARDESLGVATRLLAAREAELQGLRDELTALRERYAFDQQLAALKGDPPPELGAVAAIPGSVEVSAETPAAAGALALTAIHFDSGSSHLSPGAQVHAAAAAVMLAEMTVTGVRLVGYTDRVGSVAGNRSLAAARTKVVADFLVAQGVPVDLIEAAPMGEDEAPVSTDDGVPEPLNRSVAILALPLPTS